MKGFQDLRTSCVSPAHFKCFAEREDLGRQTSAEDWRKKKGLAAGGIHSTLLTNWLFYCTLCVSCRT